MWKTFTQATLALTFLLAAASGQASGSDVSPAALAAFKRPDTVPHPAGNPYSAAKAALGEKLFFDPRLSRDNDISCATCHDPARGWEDGRPTAIGADGLRNERHTPSVQNLAWSRALLWDGRTPTLESQVWFALTAHDEMAQDVGRLTAELAAIPDYAAAFAAVFPDRGISLITLSAALATYQRENLSGDTPFDRWVAGDPGAVPEDARRGFALFTGRANCTACHSGWNFTDGAFHDIGLPAGADLGRFRFSRDAADKYAFKTPGLRNITLRAPYMHDGSIATLRAVLEHFNGPFPARPSLSPALTTADLGAAEIDALLAFLQALESTPDIPRDSEH
ncbi:cytochrome-c peroxidase [Haliea sp. E17]|uniref:cytochrome-c peroxidase n=1 Tax=Haliea sp. E17 TaxID=3401576 RepID=UPI003AAB828B